jgi:hypothetical protein
MHRKTYECTTWARSDHVREHMIQSVAIGAKGFDKVSDSLGWCDEAGS